MVKNILFASSEVSGYAKTGGLGDVAYALPNALAEAGLNAASIMPLYGGVKIEKSKLSLVAKISITMSGKTYKAEILKELRAEKAERLFICQEQLYGKTEEPYGDKNGDYKNNDKRFIFFCRAVVEYAKLAKQTPDVIAANDWQSGLIPLLLQEEQKKNSSPLANTRSILTIHNLAYQGHFPATSFSLTGLPQKLFDDGTAEHYKKLAMLKAGIVAADGVLTVSKTYAKEILEPELGFGLEPYLQEKSRFTGVVNGIDMNEWNPETDRQLPANFSAKNLSGKAKCKTELMKKFGLTEINPKEDKPYLLAGMVGRMVEQKGFDMLLVRAYEMLKENVQLVFLGSGMAEYEEQIQALAERYPNRVGVKIGYDEQLAHQIIGGCDLFLMPSRFEPCGLTQMYALRYGTIPLARQTGGLKDTIFDADETATGNGFTFDGNSGDMLDAFKRAVKKYGDEKSWHAIQQTAMAEDNSWGKAAAEQITFYNSLI